MEDNPGYFSEIVYLRAIAILAVISVRVANDFITMNSINFLTLLYMSITTFSNFGVPLFVCISGFVLYNKYRGSFSIISFYKKRLMSVIPQYTIFSIFAVLVWYITFMFLGRVWIFSFTDFIKAYLQGFTFTHLWFIVLIIQLYILYPIIEKIFTKSVENHTSACLLIFLLFVQTLYWIYSIPGAILIGGGFFIAYIFYFVLGMYVRYNYSTYKNVRITSQNALILFLALLFATIFGIGRWSMEYFRNDLTPLFMYIYDVIFEILTPLYYIIILVFCLYSALKISEMIPNGITKSMKIIGNYSFGIYLIHAFISYALVMLVFPKIGFDMNNWLYYPIAFTLVLILSLGFVFLISKLPYHEYIIGSLK
jgi:surface polysaccharide O-acyltransferase-like enzyme